MNWILALLISCSHVFGFTIQYHSEGLVSKGICRYRYTIHNSRNPDNYHWDNDDDDNDDDDIPHVDIQKFIPPPSYGHGRSAPNQRKAMSTKSSSSTSVYVCTNCGSEFVKWMGRCPTCKNWNTLQEFKVNRKISTSPPRPIFDIRQSDSSSSSSSSRSWLGSYGGGETMENQPVRITDVYQEIESNDSDTTNSSRRPSRILIPEDDELNAVLGGGIMMGSLILIGGDPGVGK
jgi:Rubredoxin metal binding domain